MNLIQNMIVLGYGLASLFAAYRGYQHAIVKKNVFGLTPYLNWMGIFVWGDAVIIGIFGAFASLLLLVIADWWLFLLVLSIFWAVRSAGEIIYWLNQQFSTLERNPPINLSGYKWFPNDSLWFIYQLLWQGMLIVAIVGAIYSASRWIS